MEEERKMKEKMEEERKMIDKMEEERKMKEKIEEELKREERKMMEEMEAVKHLMKQTEDEKKELVPPINQIETSEEIEMKVIKQMETPTKEQDPMDKKGHEREHRKKHHKKGKRKDKKKEGKEEVVLETIEKQPDVSATQWAAARFNRSWNIEPIVNFFCSFHRLLPPLLRLKWRLPSNQKIWNHLQHRNDVCAVTWHQQWKLSFSSIFWLPLPSAFWPILLSIDWRNSLFLIWYKQFIINDIKKNIVNIEWVFRVS